MLFNLKFSISQLLQNAYVKLSPRAFLLISFPFYFYPNSIKDTFTRKKLSIFKIYA